MNRRTALLAAGLLATRALLPAGSAFDLRQRIETAAPGTIIQVPAGTYNGPFVLDKPVRLRGEPGAILRGDGRTHVVDVRAPGCEVSGFTVRRSGIDLGKDNAGIHIAAPDAFILSNRIEQCLHGIYVRKANNCVIRGNVIVGTTEFVDIPNPLTVHSKPGREDLCTVRVSQNQEGNGIHLWNSSGHIIERNRIEGTRDGMYFSFTDHTLVRGNVVEHVRYGLHYMYSDDNTFEDNRFSDNAAGSALMFSTGIVLRRNVFVANRSHRAYGILLQSDSDTTIVENQVEGNTLGIYMEYGNGNRLVGNRIVNNYVGLRLSESSTDNAILKNAFAGNLHPVELGGRSEDNRWSSGGRGNFWEDEVRVDLNRDGIADIPHHEPDLFGALRRVFPQIGLLSASPGERLVRFLHQRLDLPGIPSVTDPAPLTRPPP
ncbi:carbohydrate-binding protein [Opitutaceae bacterium EW11]|nr:carbohydrate-binding protein [Opitutaceae bacterium EW11]